MLQTIGRKAQSKPCDGDISMTLWGHYQVPQWTPPAHFSLRFVRGLLGTALNSTKGDETRSSRTENNGLFRPSFPLAAGASSKGVRARAFHGVLHFAAVSSGAWHRANHLSGLARLFTLLLAHRVHKLVTDIESRVGSIALPAPQTS